MAGRKLTIQKNIAAMQRDNVHGENDKDGVTLHETVSPDYPGFGDIIGVSQYLDNKNYGIYAVIDAEANLACALGLGRAIFYHTLSSGEAGNGNINTRKIGIELVSRVMITYPDHDKAWRAWFYTRDKQLRKAAQLIAALARAHGKTKAEQAAFMRDCIGPGPGIVTHWECTKHYAVPGGHVDCWPRHKGGYFPKLRVEALARAYYKLGYHF
jgi:N-acetylmuramoyl-L-alanine amidase-like protein